MTRSTPQRPVLNGPANDVSPEHFAAAADAATLARAHIRASARAPLHRVNRAALGYSLRLIDIFVLAILSVAGVFAIAPMDVVDLPTGALLPFIIFATLGPVMFSALDQYRIEPREPVAYRIVRAVIAAGLTGLATLMTAWITAPEQLAPIAVFTVTATAAAVLLHAVYAGFVRHWAATGRLARNIVLVGATANARKLIAQSADSGSVNVVGVFDDRQARSPSQLAGAPYLGNTDDLLAWPMLHEIDRIILTVTPKAEGRVRILLEKLTRLAQPVCLLMDFDGFDPESTDLDEIIGAPAARMSGREERLHHAFAKRMQDLVLGTGMFIAALPLMLLIGLLVRLDSPGPALFRQIREGFNGRPITVLKFRTMRHEAQPETRKIRQVEFNDPRVTRLGKFLRTTSLDELPQLWNVLTGEMSLVGPRPHAPGMRTGETETAKLVRAYAHRHRVKPGITGWAQINGSRGPLHSPEAARERVRLDVEYIARSSFWFDIWIILRTLPALLGDKINIR